jgi:hypothetical protein
VRCDIGTSYVCVTKSGLKAIALSRIVRAAVRFQ